MVYIISERVVDELLKTIEPSLWLTALAQALHAASHPEHFHVSSPPRSSIETLRNTYLFMPCSVSGEASETLTAIKNVAVRKHANPNEVGLPGTTLLFDEDSGALKAVLNASSLTGVRTAAASAVSISISANPRSTRLLVIGSGTQAYYHAKFACAVLNSLEEITLFNRSRPRLEQLTRSLRKDLPSLVIHSFLLDDLKALEKAVSDADVICLCVPSTSALFDPTLIRKGTHLTAIGSYKPHMRELDLQCLIQDGSVETVLVDSKEACLAEAGELQFVREDETYLDKVVELGTLLSPDGTFRAASRWNSNKVSVYKSVGFAAMDVAISYKIYEEARRQNLGQEVDF